MSSGVASETTVAFEQNPPRRFLRFDTPTVAERVVTFENQSML